MHYGEIISCVALAFGAALGLGGLFAPGWAAGIVRLVENPDPARPGGYSEFRATYGGLFLFSHLMTLLLVLNLSGAEPKLLTTLVVLPLSAAWIGAATGRMISLLMDSRRNRATGPLPVWMLTEIALGLAIACPFLQFL